MATFLLLLDAFRHDYLDKDITPFLWKCAGEGEHYPRVIPSLGFCERSEILSGLSGEETGFLFAIGFDPAQSPFRKSKGLRPLALLENALLPVLGLVNESFASRLHGFLRRRVNRFFRAKGVGMSTQNIPFSFLKYFALTEDRIDHRSPEAFPRPSILSLLDRAGGSYCYDTFTALNRQSSFSSDQERLDHAARESASGRYDLFLIYIAAPDAVGHRYGPDSREMKEAMRDLDRMLAGFVDRIEGGGKANRFVFVGDHGMVKVSEKIDVERELLRRAGNKGLKVGRDFIYFLDSTALRVWGLRDESRGEVIDALTSLDILEKKGRFVDAPLAEKLHIPWGDRRYGDSLWLANTGVMVFPDFFHRISACLGMHGYEPETEDSQGTCVLWGRDISPRVHPPMPLTGVYDILKRSLDL